MFSPFLSEIILLLVLLSNFIVSGVKRSRKYPVFILNVIPFSILFTYILIEGLLLFSPHLYVKIYPKLLEYVIQNMIHQVN